MRNKSVVLVVALACCKGGSDKAGTADQAPAAVVEKEALEDLSKDSGRADRKPASEAPAPARVSKGKRQVQFASDGEDDKDENQKADERAALEQGTISGKQNRARRPEGPTRAWFPETFLFEPLVVTSDGGDASVKVRVPDRLTTWRVLALAHSRTGAQGGALTSFLGTLPTYVDPIVPPTLVIGDQVRLPLQVVNTTTAPVTDKVEVEIEHASVAGGGGAVTVPAQGTVVRYATVTASRVGTAKLRVGLGETDAVVKPIEIVPAGRPMTTTRSGTLAAPRALTIVGAAGSDPATDRVRLNVFPGALALLRTELAVSTSRTTVADDAYALLLAGRAPVFLAALGDTPEPDALRSLSILASQRAIRDARSLDVASASLLAEAAMSHPERPVMMRLGERAASYLASNQRPDGTFGGGDGWTLQRVLVTTAEATRASLAATRTVAERQRGKGVAARAAGAFARNVDRVEDAYTAAAILASGAASGGLAETLKERVRKAIKQTDDGARYLDLPAGVVRADGVAPTRAEATALAVLALRGDPPATLADLGATLLGSYAMDGGWGDGRANLACMLAVLELFKSPVPADVKITLAMDGKPVAEGVIARDKVREVLVLEAAAPGVSGSHRWDIKAEPPVPGLGFSLDVQSWVAWPKERVKGGLELALPAAIAATVGRPATIAVTAVAPSGVELHIRHALPAGVQVDSPSLDALVESGAITRFATSDGAVDLVVPPLEPGETFAARYRVIPTLAGKLRSAASTITAGANTVHVPPAVWTIR